MATLTMSLQNGENVFVERGCGFRFLLNWTRARRLPGACEEKHAYGDKECPEGFHERKNSSVSAQACRAATGL